MPSTFRWGAAKHPCQPSGVVHPPGQRTNRCLGRRAGQARTGSLASGIRCTYEQARGRVQAVQPRRVQPALRYWRPACPIAAHAAGARQSARIPEVSPVPSILAPSRRSPETKGTASAARNRRHQPPAKALVDLYRSGVGDDVNAPAGQLCREPGVLAFLADGQGKLVIGNHYTGRAGCLVSDSDRIHP